MKTKSIVRRSHCWIYHSLKAVVTVCLALALVTGNAIAGEPAKAPDQKALAKASQNPVADLISVPFENNATFNNGPDDVFVNILNIKPVIPMGLTENWNLINRAIISAVYQDDGFKGSQGQNLGSQFGLGDMVYQGFISPKKPGKIIWGIGPEIHIPTGTDRLTSDQWSAGPAAVVLAMPGRWVIGGLVSNIWNIGDGYNNAADVNALTAQYFINYNFDGGWYVTSAPVMTANWEADSGDQWTVPVGGGFGRVFKIGSQHVNMKLAAYYNVDAPNDNDDVMNIQFQCTFLFPK
jgi:hypothetical protein